MKIEFGGRDWHWIQKDEKLRKVIGHVKDLQKALKHLPENKRRGAVQAGGALGVWPWYLAQEFKHVYTYEPHSKNFEYLLKNIKDVDNITAKQKGLSNTRGVGTIKLPLTETNNVGCYYTLRTTRRSKHTIDLVTIDQEMLNKSEPVDFIQLDVEGREFDVLKGAVKTIEEFSPLIMIEEKNLPQDKEVGNIKNAASDFLIDNFNYQIVETVHRDVILQRK